MKNIIIKFLALFILLGLTSLFANEHTLMTTEKKMSEHKEETYKSKPIGEMITGFLKSTGVVALINPSDELNAKGEPMSTFHKGLGLSLIHI